MREWVELSSKGIQALAVTVIVISMTFGSLRFLVHLSRQVTDPFRAYKELIGRSLLLSLEFLVAADVIRTVLLDLTAKGVGILGALVLIRTFLSWSVVVEIEGHWPWQPAAVAAESKPLEDKDASQPGYRSVGRIDPPEHRSVEVAVLAPTFDSDISRSPQRP